MRLLPLALRFFPRAQEGRDADEAGVTGTGFGLRVNHYLHQVAKAAGISDLSAKVYGSRNGTRVIKLACQMLHGGSVPVGACLSSFPPAKCGN